MRAARLLGLSAGFLLACMAPVLAASLVLPHYRYGNAEGCAYLADGHFDNDALQYLTRNSMATYGAGCNFVDVKADPDGNQLAAGICSHEGEIFLTAEDHIVTPPGQSGVVTVYTAAGDIWGELEPCP